MAQKPVRKLWFNPIAGGCAVVWALTLIPGCLLLLRMQESLRQADARVAPQEAWTYAAAFAGQRDGLFPAMAPQAGHLTFDLDMMNPDYVAEDASEACFDDDYMVYLGFAVTNEAEGQAFVQAYREQAAKGAGFDTDIPVAAGTGTLGGDTLYRLRLEMADFLDKEGVPFDHDADVAARIPVFVERPGHYRASGAWVAYLDGHTAFLPYPGPFPMTRAFVKALETLDGLEDSR